MSDRERNAPTDFPYNGELELGDSGLEKEEKLYDAIGGIQSDFVDEAVDFFDAKSTAAEGFPWYIVGIAAACILLIGGAVALGAYFRGKDKNVAPTDAPTHAWESDPTVPSGTATTGADASSDPTGKSLPPDETSGEKTDSTRTEEPLVVPDGEILYNNGGSVLDEWVPSNGQINWSSPLYYHYSLEENRDKYFFVSIELTQYDFVEEYFAQPDADTNPETLEELFAEKCEEEARKELQRMQGLGYNLQMKVRGENESCLYRVFIGYLTGAQLSELETKTSPEHGYIIYWLGDG